MANEFTGDDQDRGLQRLREFWKRALRRVDTWEEAKRAPAEFNEWGKQTSMGIFAGTILYGLRQSAENRKLGAVPVPDGLPTKLHIANYIAAQNTRRLARTLSESIRGGVHVGGATGLFLGLREGLHVYRGDRYMSSTMASAAVTGCLFGLLVGGTAMARLKSSVLMGGLGALVSYPTELAQQQLLLRLQALQPPQPDGSHAAGHEGVPSGTQPDPVDLVVAQLLSSLDVADDHDINPHDDSTELRPAQQSMEPAEPQKTGNKPMWWWTMGRRRTEQPAAVER